MITFQGIKNISITPCEEVADSNNGMHHHTFYRTWIYLDRQIFDTPKQQK